MNENKTALKPCPFCGGEATFIGDTSSIKCKTCGGAFICTNPLISTLDAKKAWNKRADNVQEVKHGRWIFRKKTKLVPTDQLAIKEGYCQVNNHNLSKSVLILKKRITVKEPICSVCGYRGYDEYDSTAYCPHCGARMDGEENG